MLKRFILQLNREVRYMFLHVVVPLLLLTYGAFHYKGLDTMPLVRAWLLQASIIFTALFIHQIRYEWMKWCGKDVSFY